ncbi:MAG: PEP-CTERM sorting domain-containing protein [Nitrospirota bacterium]|nr:PEP-CTERM sorting domain-containing protein [Nitrospirota bacterium]
MKRFLASALIVLGMAAQGWATPITINGTNGSNLSAAATFAASGTNLIVTLTNTSTSDVLVPADILTAVFFTVAGDPTLTPVSALLNAGSTVHFGPVNGGNVGGEWQYKNHLSGAPGGANEGISSSGLSPLFSSANFGGANLQGPEGLDGLQYGITSAGDNTAVGNAAVTGQFALIQSSVVFTLSGLPIGFDPFAGISNVSFQYGTALTEPNIPGRRPPQEIPVPEPGTIMLLGGGLLGMAFYGKRRMRK